MFINASNNSQLFGTGSLKLESALKNPNQYREAVLFESLNNLPATKKAEFVKSPEAKMMIAEGYITRDLLERLSNESDIGVLKTTVCHMAKENGDPLWDELVKHRIEERRIMDQLLAKYTDEAKPVADNANSDFVEACIPEYFRK